MLIFEEFPCHFLDSFCLVSPPWINIFGSLDSQQTCGQWRSVSWALKSAEGGPAQRHLACFVSFFSQIALQPLLESWFAPVLPLNGDTNGRLGCVPIGPFGPGVKYCVYLMLRFQSVFLNLKSAYCSAYTIFHRRWLMSVQVTTQLLIFNWKPELKTEGIIFYINTHITPRYQAPCVCFSSVLLCVV